MDETAHIKMAANSILMSKTFDNGMICASEQSVIAVEGVYDQLKSEFRKSGAYILNSEEKITIYKVFLEKDQLVLRSTNLDDILLFVEKDDIKIQGVVVGIIRNY